eukprot:8093740-Pyramimonas_sp.AAC.1
MLACFLEEAKEAPRSRARAWRTPKLDSAFGHSGRNLARPLAEEDWRGEGKAVCRQGGLPPGGGGGGG